MREQRCCQKSSGGGCPRVKQSKPKCSPTVSQPLSQRIRQASESLVKPNGCINIIIIMNVLCVIIHVNEKMTT